jgi:hypothetical protein
VERPSARQALAGIVHGGSWPNSSASPDPAPAGFGGRPRASLGATPGRRAPIPRNLLPRGAGECILPPSRPASSLCLLSSSCPLSMSVPMVDRPRTSSSTGTFHRASIACQTCRLRKVKASRPALAPPRPTSPLLMISSSAMRNSFHPMKGVAHVGELGRNAC